MYGHPNFTQIKSITKENVSTPPWNILKSKLIKTIVVDVRFDKICCSIISWPWHATFFP